MISILIITSLFFGKCDSRNVMTSSDNFLDITHMLNYHDFESMKTFILSNGDTKTYCNKYNDNPHYAFDGFEVYLNPETGQRNINCDPELSDFNEMVIKDQQSDPQYFHLHIVRIGDTENEQIVGNESGMIEGKVYLLKYNESEYDLESMAQKIGIYIDKMKAYIK